MRGHLRKLSLFDFAQFPQHFSPDPMIPLQTILPIHPPSASAEDLLETPVEESQPSRRLLPPAANTAKRSKRPRFDFRETFDRSRNMCVAQINAWLQRRRHTQFPVKRVPPIVETKPITPCSTPKLFGSPRLARLRQRLFKQTVSAPTRMQPIPVCSPFGDDSDDRSQYDLPVCIYFPPLSAPTVRRVPLIDTSAIASSNDDDDEFEHASPLTLSIAHRKYTSSSTLSSSSFKIITAKERRESYATSSTVFKHRYL